MHLTPEEEAIGCVDLRKRFPKLKWRREADGVTRGAWPREEHPWLVEIVCKRGIIHPHGGTTLTAVCTSSITSGRLLKLPCIEQTRGALEEMRAWFDVADAKAVFALMRPRRRRIGRTGHLRRWRYQEGKKPRQ